MQVELAQAVQSETERRGGELDSAEILRIFASSFLGAPGDRRLLGYRLRRNGHDEIEARVGTPEGERVLRGSGQGAIAAFLDGWQRTFSERVRVLDYQEHARGEGTDAEAAAYCLLGVESPVGGRRVAGAAIDRDAVGAALKAVVSAINRASSGVMGHAEAA
jgi:2-isopropylmalate synthase